MRTLIRAGSTAALAAAAAAHFFQTPTAVAGTAIRLEIEGLVERAELVLEGRVSGVCAQQDGRGRIESEVTFEVERAFLGDVPGTVAFRIPGGVLPDGRGLLLPGLPRIAEGEESILFLTAESAARLRVPVGLAQGSLRVVRDAHGAKALARDLAGLDLVDPWTGRVSAAPPEALLDYELTVGRIARGAEAKRRALREGRDPAQEGR